MCSCNQCKGVGTFEEHSSSWLSAAYPALSPRSEEWQELEELLLPPARELLLRLPSFGFSKVVALVKTDC